MQVAASQMRKNGEGRFKCTNPPLLVFQSLLPAQFVINRLLYHSQDGEERECGPNTSLAASDKGFANASLAADKRFANASLAADKRFVMMQKKGTVKAL